MRKIVIAVIILIILGTIGGFCLYRHNEARKAELATHPTPGLLLDETTEATTEPTEAPTKLDLNNNSSSDTENNEILAPAGVLNTDEESNTAVDITSEQPTETSSAVDKYTPYETESVPETNQADLKNAQQDLAAMESQMSENVRKKTYQDSLDNSRLVAKSQVKVLASKGYSQFNGITDEMIDNYSEEELMNLIGEITQIRE